MPRTPTEYHVQRTGTDREEGVLLRLQDGRSTELWRFELEGRQRRAGYTCDGDHVWMVALSAFILNDALELSAAAEALAEKFAVELVMVESHDHMQFNRGDVILWALRTLRDQPRSDRRLWKVPY